MRKIRRTAGLVFAGALAVGVTAGLGGTANAATPQAAQHSVASPKITTPSPTWNEISPVLLGSSPQLCVDVTNGSTSANTSLQLFHCHGTDSGGGPQRWHFGAVGPDEYQIWNTNSGLCLGFANNVVGAGNRIAQQPCTQAPLWAQVDVTGVPGFEELEVVGTDLVITSSSESDTNHNALVADPARVADPAQLFSIQ
jgi:ricin-type beta-trefoil lectin protein